MSSVGRLEACDASTSEWPEYHQRILLYFAARDVAEDERTAVFLTSCGTETYSLLRNLPTPTKPGDATLAAVLQHLLLLVVSGACLTLFRRDWMKPFRITISKPFEVNTVSTVAGLVKQFSDVFSDSLGTMKGVLARITL